ncbi:SRPBCC family protein [Paenibacillus thailandensis]|uniref:SRPBCC family protein n=1 Tax=Paenibacillus thailandensis TaxID=393250 RepID=A0ABW5QVC2_9BACL
MIQRSTNHSTFRIERIYRAAPERVFAAWSDRGAKARWFTPAEIFDFRVGGREYSRGGPSSGPVYTFDAYYQEIVPNERLVYTYSMDQGETRISVSVATVEIVPDGDGTKLIFTEQGTFLDGHDTPEQREHGTNILLDLLGKSLGEYNADTFELVSRRRFNVPRSLVYRAWTEPDLLASWWGPNGFTNTFHAFDLRPGGVWEFTMHGPNGSSYPNRNVFQEIGPERIVLRHESNPRFTLAGDFEDAGSGTEVVFRQTFESGEDFKKLKPICEEANKQNLDRMGSLLTSLSIEV